MTAAKGNRYALRPGKTAASTKRHIILATEEEHAEHHALATELGMKFSDLVRQLLREKRAELDAKKRASKRPRKS